MGSWDSRSDSMRDGGCKDALEAKEALAYKRNEVVRKRVAAAESKRLADAKAKGAVTEWSRGG
eukprot:3757975-Prymnesium_polylepis.1